MAADERGFNSNLGRSPEAEHADLAVLPEASILGWENPEAPPAGPPDSRRGPCRRDEPWSLEGKNLWRCKLVEDRSGQIVLVLRDRDTDMRVIELSLGARTDQSIR